MTKSLLRSNDPPRRLWFQRFLSRWNFIYKAFPHGSYTKRFLMVWRDSATKSLKVHWTMTKSLLHSTKSLLRSNAPPLC